MAGHDPMSMSNSCFDIVCVLLSWVGNAKVGLEYSVAAKPKTSPTSKTMGLKL